MRILYLQPAEYFGGAEQQGVLTMSLLPRMGIEVIPFVGPGSTICRALEGRGIHDYVYSPHIPRELDGPLTHLDALCQRASRLYRWAKATAEVARAATERRVDLIFASRTTGWTVGGAAARRLGLPTVWRAGSRPTDQWQEWGLSLLRHTFPPRALVCNSQAVFETIVPRLRCPAVVVPNGVDLERFDPQRATPRLRERHALEDCPVVGLAARPVPDKGFAALATVVQVLRARLPRLHVLVAGASGWQQHFETLFARLGLSSTVTFLGHVDEIEDFYASCDVILLPSRQRSIEGLPNALLEAMAMERPVVATQVGAVGEAVQHGEEGLLADAEDSETLAAHLLLLLENAPLRQRMGERGRAKIRRHFSSVTMANRLVRLLERCLQPQGSSVALALAHSGGRR